MTPKDPTLIHLEEWFNSAQDRPQQWFTTHARIVTIISAFVVAFVLQLDAFEVFHKISADPDLRAKLVAHADRLEKEADAVFHVPDAEAQKEHEEIVNELRRRHPEMGTSLDERPNVSTLSDLNKWLNEKLNGVKNASDISAEYKGLLLKAKLGSGSESFGKVNDEFNQTGFELLPNPYPNILSRDWRFRRFWRLSGDWSWPKRRLFGILASAALLSLGSPFWFNTLKSLTNLRPKLAEEIDKDPSQLSEKNPTANK